VAKIDLYVRSMERFGARGLVMRSGANVTLSFPTGDRHATQTTTHQQIKEMVGEIAPHEARSDISTQGQASFDYAADGKQYRVQVEARGSSWVVRLDPSAGTGEVAQVGAAYAATPAPPIATARAAVAAHAPVEPMIVERTSYAESPGDEDLPIERNQYSMGPSVSTPAVPKEVGDKLLDKLLIAAKEAGASDLHLCTGCPPLVRLHGEIRPLEGFPAFEADVLMTELFRITPEKNQEEFNRRNDTDFGYSIPKLSRFRANMFRDRKGPGAVFRAIPFEIPSAEQLGLPPKVLELCNLTKGLVLVTGPTGSGKSTTLAALIDYINTTRSDHLITIEDPIEFMHRNKKCLVNQREVFTHTNSFKDALRAALREDPDIVLVGEMRDLETIAIAIETAETGHLVFGTLHTTSAPSTVDRIIDQFPADRQEQIRAMLAESLRGVISQVLCRKKEGGRVAAYEILLANSAVANLIRERKTFQLFSVMQTGRTQGMQTMNDSLMDLVKRGIVDADEAYKKAVNKDEFRNLLGRAGIGPQ
jgi:twitching motility protein PilT